MAKLLLGDDGDGPKAAATTTPAPNASHSEPGSSVIPRASAANASAPIILNTTAANATVTPTVGASVEARASPALAVNSTTKVDANASKVAAREAAIARQAQAAANAAKVAEAKATRLEAEVAALRNKLARDEQTLSS